MSCEHNTKGGSNGHFNHAYPTKVNVSSVSKNHRNDLLTPKERKFVAIGSCYPTAHSTVILYSLKLFKCMIGPK